MTDGETVRLTYAELAAARGISVDSARRMTVRRKWPKQIGNDGLTRVSVPATAATGAGGGAREDVPTDGGRTAQAPLDPEALIAAIVSGVTAATDARTDAVLAELRLQIAAERERADRAEARAREAQDAMEAQAEEHRRIVAMLTERIPRPRRRWWRRWGRR